MSTRLLTTEMLEELQRLLSDRGARVAGAWRPQRRTRAQIAERMAEIGLDLPDELATWWAWHDGVERKEGELLAYRMVAHWEPFSVDVAVRSTRQIRQTYGDLEEAPVPWQPSWVQIAFDGSRGHLVCDTAVLPGQPSPVICGYDDGWDMPIPALPSLGELVLFWIDALREGKIHIEEDGSFEDVPPKRKEQIWGALADLI